MCIIINNKNYYYNYNNNNLKTRSGREQTIGKTTLLGDGKRAKVEGLDSGRAG